MTQPHASGPRAEAKRTLLLDAAEKVMLEKGYAGVTSRSIGAAADMPAPLVHYYYPTLDDLFVALLKRGVERSTKAFLAAVESPKPLRAVWQFHLQTRGASLTMELVALSAHRPAVRTALMEISREFQELQVEQLGQLLERYAVDPNVFPPELATLAIGGIARDIVREKVIGVTVGHDVALEAITRLIERIEGVETPAQRRPRRVRPLSVPSN